MTYYTLLASLPHLPAHFDVARPPISRAGLEQRLRMLRDEDQRVLQQLSDFLTWDRQPIDQTDEQVVAHYDAMKQELHHPVLIALVEHRINVRTIVSALRRKRDGMAPPIGVGSLVDPIRRAWQQPYFGLERRFPWMDEFNRHMLAGNALDAERVLYECTWQTWRRMAAGLTFSFDAVLLYLARWSIVDRWTSRSDEAGHHRFDQLIEETLGDYATLQF